MSRAVVIVLGAAAVLGGGCGRTSAPSPPQQFSWEVRSDKGNVTKGSGGGGFIRVDDNALEIKDGRAVANGKDAGALSPGDAVLLDKDGRLFVNGKERAVK